MRWRRSFGVLGIVTLWSCSAVFVAVADEEVGPSKSIADLSFLAGCWQGDLGEGTTIRETFTAPDGGVMLGNSQVAGGGATHFFEFIRIHETEDGVRYQPFPASKQSVEFPLAEASASHVVFENPDHDYPQRVSYRLVDGTLTAQIEKMDGSKVQTFAMQAVPCGGESHARALSKGSR